MRQMLFSFYLSCFINGVKWLHTLIKLSPFPNSELTHSPMLHYSFWVVKCWSCLFHTVKKCALQLNVHSKDDTPFNLCMGCREHIAQHLQYCSWVSCLWALEIAIRDIILDLLKNCLVACQETTQTTRVIPLLNLWCIVVGHTVCCFNCVYLFRFVSASFFCLQCFEARRVKESDI